MGEEILGNPLVVNLIGGPGVGKSTIAAGVFSSLKWSEIDCEIVTEYAKDKVWEGSHRVLEDQPYILGQQHHRQYILRDKVNVIITDSPLFLSLIYGDHWGDAFARLTLELYNNFRNMTFVIQRNKTYNPKGRIQTEVEARALDATIKGKLDYYEIPYEVIFGGPPAIEQIANRVRTELRWRG